MIRILPFLLALAACVDTAPPPQVYTCVVLYRCAGAETMTARLALPCALDLDDANERATAAGIEAADAACPEAWAFVRPLCEPYAPETECEVRP